MSCPDQIFCPIRRSWVTPLPEELVRQRCLNLMVQELGYPMEGFALEKGLRQLPHLALSPLNLPKRRADLIFFSREIHPDYPLYPLILIECKAVPLNNKVIRQVIGYNFYVKAPYVLVINQHEARTGWLEKGEYIFRSGIPRYLEIGALQKRNV